MAIRIKEFRNECSTNFQSFILNQHLHPPALKFWQLLQFFSDVEIQDLKVGLGLKILYILYKIQYIYNLKKQINVQIIGILKEIDSFY